MKMGFKLFFMSLKLILILELYLVPMNSTSRRKYCLSLGLDPSSHNFWQKRINYNSLTLKGESLLFPPFVFLKSETSLKALGTYV